MFAHWGVLAVAAALFGSVVSDQAVRPGQQAGVGTAARATAAVPARATAGPGVSAHAVGSGRSSATAEDAPTLPSVAVWRGASARHTVLSDGASAFRGISGKASDIDVACWSDRDWASVSGDEPGAVYSTFGFWQSSQPHWIHLAPATCSALQTLLTSRPPSAGAKLADAVNTLTHELFHALGVSSEARTECLSMQSTGIMARLLGVPPGYADRLARLTLVDYSLLEPEYRDERRCREGGMWDLDPERPSLPWHAGVS